MRKQLLTEIAAMAYILLFSFAAASKLFDLQTFIGQMKLQPFDAWVVPYLVWGIPTSELLIVLVLLIPKYRLMGLKMATGLMVAFTGYISLAKIGYFKDIPCSCGGVISKFTWTQHLWFNLVFLILGVVALLSPFSVKKTQIELKY